MYLYYYQSKTRMNTEQLSYKNQIQLTSMDTLKRVVDKEHGFYSSKHSNINSTNGQPLGTFAFDMKCDKRTYCFACTKEKDLIDHYQRLDRHDCG